MPDVQPCPTDAPQGRRDGTQMTFGDRNPSPERGRRQVAPDAVTEQVHTTGRVKDLGKTLQFSWPGVYFEGRFRGTGLGVVLDCAAADYDVQVDGVTVATLVTPGDTTHWINGLRDGEHTVRVVKRNETPGDISTFGGFVATPGGAVLSKPAPRDRQIEFIGDSITVGYGNVSGTRDCDSEQLKRTTNTDVSHGALTARQLDADYQINGFSGLGMVRNVAGITPDATYRTYYDRALLNVDGDVWQNPGTWRPQIVVVNLGSNDFTDLTPGEPWTHDSLAAAYRTAYDEFLRELRTRYGAADDPRGRRLRPKRRARAAGGRGAQRRRRPWCPLLVPGSVGPGLPRM